MSQSFELQAERREGKGTGAARRMRKVGKVPAVVYGGDVAPMDIALPDNVVNKSLESEAFYSHVLSLEVDGKKQDVLLKDVHRHPNGIHILHLDFQRVGANTKIKKQVPIHFIGEDVAPGVKQGGQLTHSMNNLEIVCLVKDLPEFVEADLSSLELGESFHVSDIKLPEGVQSADLLHGAGHDLPVAAIHKAKTASDDAGGDDAGEAAEDTPAEE